ncbi:MAG: formylmethanofuran dehydrogenase subunit E family protein [Theionarchaea archaeon]|nr:formylmethanofuran dehydrogenase subunit E family protein [Theionarchaea archaeon]
MNITDSFIDRAAAFHGHLGPFLVLGLKMGFLAQTILKSDPFTMKAEVHTRKTPPFSCIIDGIQFSSGCTIGKGNISVVEDDIIFGVFSKNTATIQIRIKQEILENLPRIARDDLESHARALSTKKDEELFDVIR